VSYVDRHTVPLVLQILKMESVHFAALRGKEMIVLVVNRGLNLTERKYHHRVVVDLSWHGSLDGSPYGRMGETYET